MGVTSSVDEAVIRDCEFSAKHWSTMYSALLISVFRHRGEEEFLQICHDHLVQHQGTHYNEGLRKLGIVEGTPPAIAAARYHYFTNIIAGLDLEYFEESPKKVWLRYRAPNWTFGGLSILALPSRTRRVFMTAWHPRDGLYMDEPGLQWVATKFVSEGDPYDEGYFVEHDDPVGDRIADFRVESPPPSYAPQKPALDSQEWPAVRVAKARRNFSEGYVRATTAAMVRRFGVAATHDMIRDLARIVAVQTTALRLEALGFAADGPFGLDRVLEYWSELLRATFQDFDCDAPAEAGRRSLTLRSFRPYHEPVSDALRDAWFEYVRTATRVLNPAIACRRDYRERDGVERWSFDLPETGAA